MTQEAFVKNWYGCYFGASVEVGTFWSCKYNSQAVAIFIYVNTDIDGHMQSQIFIISVWIVFDNIFILS